MKEWQWIIIACSNCAGLYSQTTNSTVVPLGLEAKSGVSNDGILESGSQFQELYSGSYLANQWTTPVKISGIAFRVDEHTGPYNGTIPRVEIRLSTSQNTPTQMSLLYANNKGLDETIAFLHDNVALFSAAGQQVNPFDLRFTFDQPFTYDPKNGSLLLYMKTTGFGSTQVDADGVPSGSAAYVGNSGPFADGQVVRYSPVIQFSWSAIPEPQTVGLIVLGSILVCRQLKTR